MSNSELKSCNVTEDISKFLGRTELRTENMWSRMHIIQITGIRYRYPVFTTTNSAISTRYDTRYHSSYCVISCTKYEYRGIVVFWFTYGVSHHIYLITMSEKLV
jgi:hypothetical protein